MKMMVMMMMMMILSEHKLTLSQTCTPTNKRQHGTESQKLCLEMKTEIVISARLIPYSVYQINLLTIHNTTVV
jgi:hypothetical protein